MSVALPCRRRPEWPWAARNRRVRSRLFLRSLRPGLPSADNPLQWLLVIDQQMRASGQLDAGLPLPDAEERVLLLHGGDCSLFDVEAPPGLKPAEWPLLVEELLLDREPQHWVRLATRDSGLHVLAVRRELLLAWEAQCVGQGLSVDQWLVDFQLLPAAGPDALQLLDDGDCLLLKGLVEHGQQGWREHWLCWPRDWREHLPPAWQALPCQAWQLPLHVAHAWHRLVPGYRADLPGVWRRAPTPRRWPKLPRYGWAWAGVMLLLLAVYALGLQQQQRHVEQAQRQQLVRQLGLEDAVADGAGVARQLQRLIQRQADWQAEHEQQQQLLDHLQHALQSRALQVVAIEATPTRLRLTLLATAGEDNRVLLAQLEADLAQMATAGWRGQARLLDAEGTAGEYLEVQFDALAGEHA